MHRNLVALVLAGMLSLPVVAEEASLAELFNERTKTLVYVEYFIQREMDRQNVDGVGLLLNDEGLVVCLPNVFPDWVPPDWYRAVKVFPADNPLGEGIDATYLGQDWVNAWHYIRIEDMEAAAPYLRPITDFETGIAEVGDLVWGVCMTPGDLDYIAYFREGKLSTVQRLPLDTAFATSEVAVPGGPVFLEDGRFAGWAGRSLPMERDMWIGSEFFRANIRNPDETHMYLLAEPFLEEAGLRVPSHPLEHFRPWIGISGTQPLDKETSKFLGLTDRGVVIISEVLPETPAERAGLEDGDFVLAINGETIPRLKPDSILQVYFERQMLSSRAGEPLKMTILREDEEIEVELIPESAPTLMKEARRQYFDDLGVTLREYIKSDALQRREDHRELRGAVVNFIRPNSLAAAGSLQPGDWVQEIGGVPIGDYAEAVEQMETLLADEALEEIVLLVERSNETTVLRIKKQ